MTDKLLCPLLNKPCIESRCMAWQIGMVEEQGVTKAHAACVEFFWKPLYLKGIANRSDGTQRAIESFRNEMVSANNRTLLLGGLNLPQVKGAKGENNDHPK